MIDEIQSFKADLEPVEERLVEEAFENQPVRGKSELIENIATYITAGKHIRGGLYLIAISWFDDVKEADLEVAASIELLHSAMLIQDDIMDNDVTRRGMPSLHKQFESMRGNRRVSEGMAVCIADLLIFQAFTTLAGIDDEVTQAAGQCIREVTVAQFRDVTHDDPWNEGYEPTIEEIINLHENKTGRYTFGLPLEAGFHRLNKDLPAPLKSLTEDLGVVYQLRDDELNVFGDSNITGKPSMTDVEDGTRTVLRKLLLDEHPEVEEYFGVELDADDKESLRQRFDTVREEHERVKADYADQARNKIEEASMPNEAKNQLFELTDFIAHRQR